MERDMTNLGLNLTGLLIALGLATASFAQERLKPAAAVLAPIAAEGTVTVPSYKLPPSVYLSAEARAILAKGPDPRMTGEKPPMQAVPAIRSGMKQEMAPFIEALRNQYKVQISETTVGGIHGYWVKPAQSPKSRSRPILLNLPAGGFLIGQANPIGLVEAIPVSGMTGFDILTIDYRQAPEAVFPAASEDVTKVYRELLKSHAPARIGIYGCSAGGLLTAQSLAWFQKEGLPMPGAAGILCASADGRWAGDSWFWQKPIQGLSGPPSLDEEDYYGKHDQADPLLSPIESDAVLKRFPPTLLITATRAGELSSTVNTHRLLVRNGVEADLHVWDGLGHAFYTMTPDMPESREALNVIANFFTTHLTKKGRK
jgi:acetyl esterase/lipase